MLSDARHSWTPTFLFASLAVAFAGVGLALSTFYPGAAPMVAAGLLVASLASTAAAFTRLALRVRRLELENEGLIEEISQEFDRVKDKLEIFSEALAEPRSLSPDEAAPGTEQASARRVVVK